MFSVDTKTLSRMALLVLLALGSAAAKQSSVSGEPPQQCSPYESPEHAHLRVSKGSLPQSHAKRNLQGVQITRLALINADSNSEITTVNLGADAVISLNALPSVHLSIVAIVTGTGISKPHRIPFVATRAVPLTTMPANI